MSEEFDVEEWIRRGVIQGHTDPHGLPGRNGMSRYMKINNAIIFIIIAFILGFFAGRVTLKRGETIEYVKGEQVNGTVYTSSLTVGNNLTEFKTNIQELPIIFWKNITDTITNTIITEVDTAKIVEDFLIERQYDLVLFDNTDGVMKLQPVVQYNKLQKIDYQFTPITKVITTTKDPLFTPFISTSYNTLNYIGVGGGGFIKDFGIEYSTLYNFITKDRQHLFGVKYKF